MRIGLSRCLQGITIKYASAPSFTLSQFGAILTIVTAAPVPARPSWFKLGLVALFVFLTLSPLLNSVRQSLQGCGESRVSRNPSTMQTARLRLQVRSNKRTKQFSFSRAQLTR
jgi:hypothetical protein